MPKMYAVEIADGEDAAALGRAVVRGPFGGLLKAATLAGLARHRKVRGTAKLRRFVYPHVKLQSVVRQRDICQSQLAEPLVGFRVRQIVGDVREPRLPRLQPLD